MPTPLSRPATPTPPRVKAKAKYDNPANARAAERKLLAAMRERPGLSAASLAKVVGAGLSTTKERLRRMDAQELIEKAKDGRWQVKAEEPRSTEDKFAPYAGVAELLTATPKADRNASGPAAAHPLWLKPISDYERKETTLVEGTRYG